MRGGHHKFTPARKVLEIRKRFRQIQIRKYQAICEMFSRRHQGLALVVLDLLTSVVRLFCFDLYQ